MAESPAGLDTLILALGNAAATRSLYPAGHPQAEAALDRVFRTLEPVLAAGREELSLLAIDEELAVDGKPWNRGESGRTGLVRAFQRAGIESVRIAPGTPRDEIGRLVQALAGAGAAESTEHVAVGRVARWGTRDSDSGYDDLSIEQGVDAAYDALVAFQHDLRSGFARLERAVWSVIEAMANEQRSFLLLAGLERQNDRLWRHSINVSLYATRLARALGIEGAVLHDLAVGALLHDVGYLALGASGDLSALTPEQRRRHPERGAALLAGVDGMPGTPILVAFEHHRAWDGSAGYPAAAQPPNLASQITAVADTWDTLLQTRKPLPHGSRTEAAVATLTRLRGNLLHPDLVNLFLELLGLSSVPTA